MICRFRILVLLAGVAVLAGCAGASKEIVSTGWAWPLPPPSQRSDEFAERARAVADSTRLREAYPWADQQATGRGSASLDPTLEDPVIADLVRRAQAREAARRHLAERVAALPMIPAGTRPSGPTPRLGDPGRLRPEIAARLSALIARAPVQREAPTPDNRFEVVVSLPLSDVARILLGEDPVEVSIATIEEEEETTGIFPGPSRESPSRSAAAQLPKPDSSPPAAVSPITRSGLPPVGDFEFLAAVAFESSEPPRLGDINPVNSPDSASPDPRSSVASRSFGISPEARYEAERRAAALARQWLWQELRTRRTDEKGPLLGELAALLPDIRRDIRARIEAAPVRSVYWDSLGRCRVTVTFDWKAYLKGLNTVSGVQGSPASAGPALPIP